MEGLDELVRYNLAAVPDPGILVLLGSGAAGLGALWRRYVRRRDTTQEAESRDKERSSVPPASSPENA